MILKTGWQEPSVLCGAPAHICQTDTSMPAARKGASVQANQNYEEGAELGEVNSLDNSSQNPQLAWLLGP